MMRLTITHPEITPDNLHCELKCSREKRQAIRIMALVKLLEGNKVGETMRFFGFERGCASEWIKRVNKEGLSGLEIRPGRGVKSRLSEKQKEILRSDLARSPKSFSFQANLWTGKILKEHIKRKFSVTYKLSTMYVLFSELGLTLQRPTRRYLGAKFEKQREFKSQLKKNHQGSQKKPKQCSSR